MSMNRYRGGWGEWGPGAMWLLVIGSYVVLGQSTSWHFLWEQVVCLDPNPTPTHDTRALGAMKWQSPCPSPGRHPRRVFSDGGGDEQLVLAGTAGADPRRRRGSDLAERGAISVQVPDFLRIGHPGRSCAARSEDRRSTRSLPAKFAGPLQRGSRRAIARRSRQGGHGLGRGRQRRASCDDCVHHAPNPICQGALGRGNSSLRASCRRTQTHPPGTTGGRPASRWIPARIWSCLRPRRAGSALRAY